MLQEMLSIWCVTGEDIVEIPQKLDLVTPVKRAARNENAFQLQVGYRGIHNDGTNVLGAGEVVPGYRKMLALQQEMFDERFKSGSGRRVTVDEVFQHGQIIGAGKNLAGRPLAIAPGAPGFLDIVLQ